MEYLVSRTSFWNDEKPAKGCYKEEYITHDVRTLDSFEKYDMKFRDNFKDIGFDHCINDRGYIQRSFNREGWFINIDTIEELNNFIEEHSSVVIETHHANENILEIEIYDGYRE